MKYLSLFSGIGGFELGIQQAYEYYKSRQYLRGKPRDRKSLSSDGNKPINKTTRTERESICDVPKNIGYSEIDKYAIQIYEKHFNHKNYGDITKINPKELPDFDLVVGGFPCQSFSIAGKRGGFNDTRGTLFFEIARIVREKQPRFLLLENVKGLLSHDKGRAFFTIISTLDELGYDCQWQVLNSKNFGVPQNRERVFIIGHLRGTSRPEVFPFGEGDGDDKKARTILQVNNPKHSNDRVYEKDGLSPALNTAQGGRRQPKIVTALDANYYKGVGIRGNKMRATANEYTGDCPYGCNEWDCVHNWKIRRLTPTECERLQGFPDGWTEGLSDTQRYKTLGNAVTVNVIREIMKKLI